MEIMQLIQLHSFHHGEKDAADSTAFFFSFWGGLGRAAPGGPPRMKKKDAVESAASFPAW